MFYGIFEKLCSSLFMHFGLSPLSCILGSHAILDVCIVNKGENVAHKFMYACFEGELHVVKGSF